MAKLRPGRNYIIWVLNEFGSRCSATMEGTFCDVCNWQVVDTLFVDAWLLSTCNSVPVGPDSLISAVHHDFQFLETGREL